MKKKNVVQTIFGLLPNCIAQGNDFVLQYNKCVASWKGREEWKLYCKKWLDCIAAWGENCIAEVALYCNRECSRLDRFVLQ